MRYRALIVEDEAFLRAALKEALALIWPELEIVGEAENGGVGLSMVEALRPDLVFLDIRLPGLSGLEVARMIQDRCHIVFLTAYGEHALAAFEAGAVDYLLKPIDRVRLQQTCSRIKSRIGLPPPNLHPHLPEITSARLEWIHASSGNQIHIIASTQVAAFVAEAKYTRLLGLGFDAHIRKTIKELADTLAPEQFRQISRSAIVNLSQVSRLKKEGEGNMRLWIGQDEFKISQPYQGQFRQM